PFGTQSRKEATQIHTSHIRPPTSNCGRSLCLSAPKPQGKRRVSSRKAQDSEACHRKYQGPPHGEIGRVMFFYELVQDQPNQPHPITNSLRSFKCFLSSPTPHPVSAVKRTAPPPSNTASWSAS